MSSSSASNLVEPQITCHILKPAGHIPNNPALPLLVYHSGLQLPEEDPAPAIERLLRGNRWGGMWRNGVYNYHHYHSTAHEVLVVYSGSAELQLGGEPGVVQQVKPGDAVLIPAGVGHKNLGATTDFAVVGAYPEGQEYDMNYGKPEEHPAVDENIRRLPVPASDPLYGPLGPLLDYWKV